MLPTETKLNLTWQESSTRCLQLLTIAQHCNGFRKLAYFSPKFLNGNGLHDRLTVERIGSSQETLDLGQYCNVSSIKPWMRSQE